MNLYSPVSHGGKRVKTVNEFDREDEDSKGKKSEDRGSARVGSEEA